MSGWTDHEIGGFYRLPAGHIVDLGTTSDVRGHIPDGRSPRRLPLVIAEMRVPMDDKIDPVIVDDPAQQGIAEHPVLHHRFFAKR